MDNSNFKQSIKPFFWIEHKDDFSVCLEAGSYKNEIFSTKKEDGFEGNGYDWTSLAKTFLAEKLPQLNESIDFDSEAEMFSAYSTNEDALRTFVVEFKKTCEDETLIEDLFSKIQID